MLLLAWTSYMFGAVHEQFGFTTMLAEYIFRTGYIYMFLCVCVVFISPLTLAAGIWLSLHHRKSALEGSPAYRNGPLICTALSQGTLVALLLLIMLTN